MLFIPISILIFVAFILFLPVILTLGYFHVITIGFEKLGITPELTIIVLFLILIGSFINIPITRIKYEYLEEKRFFGLFGSTKLRPSGVAINLGGAIIPILLSIYFLFFVPLKPVLIAVACMTISIWFLARIVPGRGIVIPVLLPPILALFFSYIFVPEFLAPCAFISGVLGTLIGGDILKVRKARQVCPGLISIGGAGVFDGIFLVGIVSALFS